MAQFENVTVVTNANVYFEGKVTSRTVVFADGSRKTLGIMLPGEFEFGTGAPEIMEIQSGSLDVLLPGETEWQRVEGPGVFNVPGNSKFALKVYSVTDYICSFIRE